MSNKFDKSIPILPVSSVRDTAKFYEEEFGFKIAILWGHPPYAVVKRDSASIEFGEGRPNNVGGGVCYLIVGNADEIYEDYRGKDLEFVGDLSDRDYGNRDFRVKDNNGNMLIIGHCLENHEELVNLGNVA